MCATPFKPAAGSTAQPGHNVLWCTYALGLIVLAAAMALRAARPPDSAAAETPGAGGSVQKGLRIDPNVAGWAELATLPGLGEVIARRIVAHRQKRSSGDARAFSGPDDLLAVNGIGPKRVASLSRFLRFDAAGDSMSP